MGTTASNVRCKTFTTFWTVLKFLLAMSRVQILSMVSVEVRTTLVEKMLSEVHVMVKSCGVTQSERELFTLEQELPVRLSTSLTQSNTFASSPETKNGVASVPLELWSRDETPPSITKGSPSTRGHVTT